MNRIIEVLITPQGETRIQTKGFTGPDCLQSSKFLELALGQIIQDYKTEEYYQTTETKQNIQQ